MTTKRTRKGPHPAKVAAAFVADRLAFCSDYADFISTSSLMPRPRVVFADVVKAARGNEWPQITEDMVLTLAGYDGAPEGTLVATEQAHARAGFLVGLELGRRLAGGAR